MWLQDLLQSTRAVFQERQSSFLFSKATPTTPSMVGSRQAPRTADDAGMVGGAGAHGSSAE